MFFFAVCFHSTTNLVIYKLVMLNYDVCYMQVASNKLRWAVGCILGETESEADPQVRAAYAKEKYKFMTLPAVKASVNCVFPYINMLSIFIAIKRVYPALASYINVRSCLLLYV